MALELDSRQRAMLLEMGVHVWLPGAAFAPAVPARAPEPVAPLAATAVPRVALRPKLGTTPVATPGAAPVAATPSTVAQAVDASALGWDALAQTVAACQACALCGSRKTTTLRAPAQAQMDWMVVGDPPDEDEDREGQPFAQAQGQLLDNMLKAVGASRTGSGASGAYLTNIVKCRPPHGRIPQAAELAQCAAYLQQEIALVRPRMILAMGRFAMQVLLGEQPQWATQPLGKLRGAVYQYRGVPVVVTYAPKVLLRAPADKAKAWADLCLAMDTLEAS
ncbi:MAG: uracil-DNA glycosylase [Burkholderiales bacterium]|nr:uracil-DNA glycosylase [Burkholderiales bacterium]